MDFGTIIIGAIAIALCILPFAMSRMSRINREKQLLKSLFKIAEKHKCELSGYEVSGNIAIGIDNAVNSLFFYKKTKDKETSQYVNLADFQSCKIINSGGNPNNKSYSKIHRLALGFTSANGKPDVQFEFYNHDENLQLTDELQTIEKWAAIANSQMKLQKTT